MSLAELSQEWNETGCAICSARPRGEELGYYIELHHLHGRGFPDDDAPENILGACGAFINGCHQAITENQITLSEVEGVGWVWEDHRSGSQGVCRSLQNRLSVALTPPKALYDMKAGMATPADYLPPEAQFEDDSLQACQGRLELTRALVRQINRATLDVALIVYEVAVRREFMRMDMPTIKEWAAAAEIAPSTLQRMLWVGKYFRGRWQDLPKVDRDQLTLDRLHYAARLALVGVYDSEEEALHAAVSEPQRYLWQQFKETQEAGFEWCDCPTCGHHHVRREPEA